MENQKLWKINEVKCYKVNDKLFYDKNKAKDYSLKLFLIRKVSKFLIENNINNILLYIDKDNCIVLKEYRKPIKDNWNLGHYGCTEANIIDRDEIFKFDTIQKFYEAYYITINGIINKIDSINIEILSTILDETQINDICDEKNMITELKKCINLIDYEATR